MERIFIVLVGLICIGIGIANRHGNISMIHSYHRKRVSEEDRIPYGRCVGNGMIIIGGGISVMGALTYASTATGNGIYEIIGGVVVIVSLVAGVGLAFFAMKKYNKGIF